MSSTPRTRLDHFIEQNNISSAALAESAGVSPETLEQLRREDGDPTLAVMRDLLNTCRRITGRKVEMTDLFDLGED
jgi:DNA-binding XRE family transcriptional regulator